MSVEKRKERRLKVSLPIRILYQDNPEIVGRVENISRLGAYAEIDREIPEGTDINAVIEIPVYAKDLSLNGEVRCKANIFRSRLLRELDARKYYGIGIFFTEFPKQSDRDKLSKYIDFLILKEEKDIRAGLSRWRSRRASARKNKQVRQGDSDKKEIQGEPLILLKQILVRLEEIQHLLESQNKAR